MSVQKQPGSFGVLFPAFSLPMKAERSRNKERLEASLAGLCELELLKQRQESRVLSALCLGDALVSGHPPWGALQSANCALVESNSNARDDCGLRLKTCTPCGIKSSLEEQVADLKMNTDVKEADSLPDTEERELCSGEDVVTKPGDPSGFNQHQVVPHFISVSERTGEKETGESWLPHSKRQAIICNTFGDMRVIDYSQEDQQAQKVESYIFGLIQRRALTPRPSKPRTSLAHDARAASAMRQSTLYQKVDQHSPKQLSAEVISTLSQGSEGTAPQACHKLDQELHQRIEFIKGISPLFHLEQSAKDKPGISRKLWQTSIVNTSHSASPDYASFILMQANQDSGNSEPELPQHFHNYHSPPALSKTHHPPIPNEQLVIAHYIPAQPCQASTRAHAHHPSNTHNKPSGVAKPNRGMFSPERGNRHEEQQPTASQILPPKWRGGTKKCRLNEDKSCGNRKPGKKACRSQSEISLQRVQERKCNTERDGGGNGGGCGGRGSRSSQFRSKKQFQGSGNCRLWQSTLEFSQDEADLPPMQAPMQGSSVSYQRDHVAKRTRRNRYTHTSYAYPHHNQNQHHHSHHQQQLEFQFEKDQVALCKPNDNDSPAQGESESSMSEADSPDSSSLSSDSDEIGLVWPQQLPPQLSLPSPSVPHGAPLQPRAFVKIKASHALKKKILRFRTGSLKVMTTV
ncbi:dapper homolog 1-like [Echeneis naucrates]|uniref:dapper homolog 1-like n=1 Tax=Echeneis naucrates TaxID=173247 RepID=UPI0011141A2E|nr:dapper homolog 1-like [Echeneis naucrates]